jgi:hypothetical protein
MNQGYYSIVFGNSLAREAIESDWFAAVRRSRTDYRFLRV